MNQDEMMDSPATPLHLQQADMQRCKPASYIVPFLFVLLFVFVFDTDFRCIIHLQERKKKTDAIEFSSVFLKGVGYASQLTDSLMSDSSSAISCS